MYCKFCPRFSRHPTHNTWDLLTTGISRKIQLFVSVTDTKETVFWACLSRYSFCCFHLAWASYCVTGVFRILSQKFIILLISLLMFQSVSKVFVDPVTACSLLKYSDDHMLVCMFCLRCKVFPDSFSGHFLPRPEVIHNNILTKIHAFFNILNKTSKELFQS